MATSTFTGVIQSGKNKDAPCGVVQLIAHISFDPTQATTGTGFILPAGAVVTAVYSLGGATGGIDPTVDIGTSSAAAGFVNELDADGAAAGTLGSSALSVLAADTEIYAGVGSSAATGGTTTIAVVYYRTA